MCRGRFNKIVYQSSVSQDVFSNGKEIQTHIDTWLHWFKQETWEQDLHLSTCGDPAIENVNNRPMGETI